MIKQLTKTISLSLILMGAVHACDVNLEAEFSRIDQSYSLCPAKYTESLTEQYQKVLQIVSQAVTQEKPVGIVVGENHNAEGAKCFEMFLLQIAQSAGIQHCLIELTPQKFQQVLEKGHTFSAEGLYLSNLIREAKRLAMQTLPIDKEVEDKKLTGLDEIKEMFLAEGEDREKHFIQEMLALNKRFISYNGSNHLSTLYYDEELNKNYFLIFINCSFAPTKQNETSLEQVINAINDVSVFRIHAQRQKFLTETERSYQMPIMYNQHQSMGYKIMLKMGPIYGVNLNEIRDYNPDQQSSENQTS